MRRLKINYLLIALAALILTVAGIVGAYFLSDTMSASATWYGAGTESDPYRIYDSSQFYNLQELSSSPVAAKYTKGKYFVLKNDVELHTAARESIYGFGGVLDGDGHTVALHTGELFHRLQNGAAIKGLTIRFGLKASASALSVCAAAHVVSQNALIENCTAEGSLEIAPFPYPEMHVIPVLSCAPFAVTNNGTIRGCTFRGTISGTEDTVTAFYDRVYIGGIAARGSGKIEGCEVHATFDIKSLAFTGRIAGVSPECPTESCKFYGDINIGCDRGVRNAVTASKRTTVYGVSPAAADGYFEGNIILDSGSTPAQGPFIAGEESTFEFRGKILKRGEDGALNDWIPADPAE